MGDALCGPSNALQTFRKQTQADRSLQQDRLAARNPAAAAQGFRSSPGPNAGILDAEFEAFQNGSSMGIPPQELHHGPMHAGPAFQPQQMPGPAPGVAGPGGAGWAADFQRLHISQPAARPQQQNMSNWHQEFAQQNRAMTPQSGAQSSYLPQMHQPQPYAMNYMQQPSYSAGLPQYGQSQTAMAHKGKEKETFDDAAFELEFQRHANEALEQQAAEAQISEDVGRQESAAQAKAQADLAASSSQRQAARSHFDGEMNPLREWAEALRQNEVEETIQHAEEKHQEAPSMLVDEDLARTAGELLERVADDSSEKFRNSEFLRLMRRVRDGDATIRDGQMLDGEQDSQTVDSAAARIPASEQDADVGRDARMTGALLNQQQPNHDASETQQQQAKPKWDAEQYGRHTVDDF